MHYFIMGWHIVFMLNSVNDYKIMMVIERGTNMVLTESLQQSLSLEILVCLLVDNIALTVLIFFLLKSWKVEKVRTTRVSKYETNFEVKMKIPDLVSTLHRTFVFWVFPREPWRPRSGWHLRSGQCWGFRGNASLITNNVTLIGFIKYLPWACLHSAKCRWKAFGPWSEKKRLIFRLGSPNTSPANATVTN